MKIIFKVYNKNIFLIYLDEQSANLDTYIVGYISKEDFINKSVYNPIFYCNTVDEKILRIV